jgi:hypothetical protein
MNRWTKWIVILLSFALIAGCSNAQSYVSDHYPLVDVQGKGKDTSKIYAVEGKDVPAVAKELAAQEQPKEMSKESPDQMFLAYTDKIVQVQKDPANDKNSLVEISTIEYAKNHYDSSFLQGYLTATLIQSLFGGGGWFGRSSTPDYRGYTNAPRSGGSSPYNSSPQVSQDKKPATSDRTGSFNSKPGSAVKPDSGTADKPPTGASSGTFRTTPSDKSGSVSSSTGRKSDGSTPSYKSPSKPSTSTRSGSFSRRR